MRNAFVRKMLEIAKSDPSVIQVTGDLGYHCFEPFIKGCPDQFLNVGICEQSMAGISAGLAMGGRKVFMYSISNFPTLRCQEQIRNDICYHDLPVYIVANGGGMAYGYLGMSHHATEDISIMRSQPNMLVSAPSDPSEVEGLMDYIHRRGKPAYLRMNRGGEPVLHPSVPSFTGAEFLPLSPEQNPRVILVGTGEIGNLLPQVVTDLRQDGLSAEAVLCPIVKPFPPIPDKWLTGSGSVQLIVTVEENNEIGGLGGAFAEALAELPAHPRLLRIGMPDTYCSCVGRQNYLREKYLISQGHIVQRIKKALGGSI